MPTSRRYRHRLRKPLSELTLDLRYELESGMSFFGGFGGDFGAFADAWELHRDALMAKFARERPGTRPFAYWVLDFFRAEPAPNLTGADRRYDSMRHRFRHVPIPARSICPGWGPEADFLDQHGLLTSAERNALCRPAHPPSPRTEFP